MFLILLHIPTILTSQQITIHANDAPLNEVVFKLIEKYNLQLSYNEKQLSGSKITLNGTFETPESALAALLDENGLSFQKAGDIYIILKKKIEKLFVKGWVGDKFSGESLPFAHVLVNGRGLITDLNGIFSLEVGDKKLSLSVSYLGYYKLDTIVNTGSHAFKLLPAVNKLKEITIKGKQVARSMEFGNSPGEIRLNQITARKIPGNGDNAIFNFLRLQPGILAAGEQSTDLIIWGGYEGQSKVIFDGFTLYGLKNFNDNISAVNPYMAKDLLILKGGYSAEYGGRVGGVVDITGISGDKYSPSINLNINNMTLNGMASVPVFQDAALTLAFRRTYYNLYNPDDFSISNSRKGNNQATDIAIVPDYSFGDFNLKFAGEKKDKEPYYISLYQGNDNFQYNVNKERQNVRVVQNAGESNRQRGGSAYWSSSIHSSLRTDIKLSYSDLINNTAMVQDISRLSNSENVFTREQISRNNVSELSLLNRYYFSLGHQNLHSFQAGIGYDNYHISLVSNVDDQLQLNKSDQTGNIIAYVLDNYHIGSMLTLNPGIRLEHPGNIAQTYVQPRFSVRLQPYRHFNMYAAWGIYNQFVSKTSILDDYGNYQYYWAIADNIDIPVLSSVHYLGGLSYNSAKFTASAEGYYKITNGLTRYVNLIRQNIISVFKGDSKSYGVDFLLKGIFNKHEAWIGYSLSKTLEHFEYFQLDKYRYAPQDQRHELKTSVILNFKPVYFSANYIYGSGFLLKNIINSSPESERFPYNRADVSVYYDLTIKSYAFEIGLSVLNVFNTENIKYANFIRVPAEQLSSLNIHAEAVPFTPAIFLNLAF